MGLYSLYLPDWLKAFERDKILFVNYDNFYNMRVNTIGKVVSFLKLRECHLPP